MYEQYAPKHHFDPSMLEALGGVVTLWAAVEGLQSELFSFLLEADPGKAYIVTQNVSARSVTDWIRTLVPVVFEDEETISGLTTLLKSIDEARAERNTLVHGIWKPGEEAGTVLVQTIKWERTEIARHELVTHRDLVDLIEHLRELVGELIFVGNHLGYIH